MSQIRIRATISLWFSQKIKGRSDFLHKFGLGVRTNTQDRKISGKAVMSLANLVLRTSVGFALRPASFSPLPVMNTAAFVRFLSKKKGSDDTAKGKSVTFDVKSVLKMDRDGQLDFSTLKVKFAAVKEALVKDLATLRPGRASANLLDGIHVSIEKNSVPLLSIANVSVQNAQMILVQPFDGSHVRDIEKALRISSLGLNPIVEGETVKLPMPKMTQTHRQDMVKTANNYGEETKNTIRKLRRACMDDIKGLKGISEDIEKKFEKNVDKAIDAMVKEVSDMLKAKEKELNN